MNPDFLTFLRDWNGQTPESISTAPITSRGIQEELGALQPDTGGSIKDILSGRFDPDPSYGNYAQSAIGSLHGEYAPASDYANQDVAAQLKQISALTDIQKSGGDSPAPLKLANEYQRRMAAGDTQGANLIMQFAKAQEKGLQVDANGQFTNLPGYAPALGVISNAKQTGQNQSDLTYKPQIAADTEKAKTVTDAQTNLPLVIDQASQSTKVIDDVLKHPGLAANFGMAGQVPNLPGSAASDAKTYLDQIRGGSFLTAFNQLRGGGQISNVEGAKAETAYARMQSAQSLEAFKTAAQDYKDIINKVVAREKNKASGAIFNQSNTTPIAPASSPIDYKEYFK